MYNATIISTNVPDVSKKMSVYLKDTSDAVVLNDAVTTGESIIIAPKYWAVIDIENDRVEDGKYINYVIIDKDGVKYVTGSESFWNAFERIAGDMGDDDFDIRVFKRNSKNNSGTFITCAIVM